MLFAFLGAMLMLGSCKDPEPQDPSALIPDWRTYYNREVGIEFQYPYTLNLDVDTSTEGELLVELQWVGRETPVFWLQARPATADDLVGAAGAGSARVGGLAASSKVVEIDGETFEHRTVVNGGKVFEFTGSGTTFEKVLDSVKFLGGGIE